MKTYTIPTNISTGISDSYSDPDSSDLCYRFNHYNICTYVCSYIHTYTCMYACLYVCKGIVTYGILRKINARENDQYVFLDLFMF